MQRRYNLAYFILASVVVLGLTLLMVAVNAQAQIAFTSRRDGNSEIYVMDADRGNQRNLTNNRDDDFQPSWSPDGKRIVFVSERDGNSEIYVMNADGSNPQNLTNNPGNDIYPSWSPDGKRIAFASDRDRPPDYDIYVMDDDGKNQQRLTNNPHRDQHPSWSPDGKRIVFSARRDGHFRNNLGITDEIYVMDADSGNPQRLTENRSNDWMPSWSPNGKRIAFASDRDRPPDYDIYVMDDDGDNPQNLTNNPRNDVHPAWFGSAFAVAPAGKVLTIWGWLKQVGR